MTRPEPLYLNAVVGNILRMLGRLIGEDVTIAFEPTPGLWPVMADRGEIEQVLVNLAVNARDAMPGGGCLAIDLTNVEVDGASPRLREGGRPGPHVRLGVSDTGSGMDPDTARRLFEPFFTTKPAGKGTGLGLSVVYGIVAGAGGWIAVTSESGKGTRFEVHLPRCADTARAAGGGEGAGAPTRGGAESILLVEDDPPLRAIGVLTLTRQGYAVLEAASAEDAQACLVAADGRVDLVVTDILMTGQNGLQLAEWIRGRWPSIRVLFMSGYAGDAVAKHGLREGDVAFLQKPFTPDSLARKVRETLDA